MSVNQLSKEQSYELLNELHKQATGMNSIAPVDSSGFVTMAQATLVTGYNVVVESIAQVIGQTIFSIRPYSRKFKGLEMDNVTWGGIRRKLSIADRDAVENNVYTIKDGDETNPFKVRIPNILETRFVGSLVYDDYYSITKQQLKTAFSNESEFGSFMSMLVQNASDKWEQWLEENARMCVCNFIGAKNQADSDSVIHLLTEYNEKTGLSLDAQSVYQPENFQPFMLWVHSRISDLTDKMTERSVLFQMNVTGKEIQRHTPLQDQKVYILSKALAEIKSMVKSITYNDDYLTLSDVEGVGYWQSIKNPDEIQITPCYMNENGEVVTGDAQTLSNVFGVIFDRDAIGYNVFDDSVDSTMYEPRHKYFTIWHHADYQYTNDLTEKGIVLLLD